ncbi:GerAB/ArcD/ProY family transporter [Calidifontibacillus oryziterrae]|uniref:GerAB/ArcD/ProY family transporter n=1 Tax=Calidifontibacillus oryziterrae TaxID=1191699 RepID=UPI000304CADB|nr:GerAB/ArcD/ProY family transporter [Calidifontibacillus oryziterrae]
MRVQITNGMFMALIINMVYAKAIGVTQGSMAREVGRDIWLSTIFASVIAALLMLIIVSTIWRMPEGDIFKHGGRLVGPWFEKLLGVLFFIFFFGAFTVSMVTFVYHIKDYFLPEIPIWGIVLTATIVSVYAIHFGIEVVSRMALIGVFSILCLNILVLLGSLEKFDIRELLPVFESGVGNTMWAGRHYLADWTTVIMMSAIILPIVKNPPTWKRSGLSGVLYGAGFVAMWPIIEVGVMSANVTAQYAISCMQMARSAQIGLYVHRYELIMVIFFALSILTQLMMSLYCACVSLQRTMSFKDYRGFIIPSAVLLGLGSFWIVNDSGRAMEFTEMEWIGIGLSLGICIPLFVWLIGFVLKNKLKNNDKFQ